MINKRLSAILFASFQLILAGTTDKNAELLSLVKQRSIELGVCAQDVRKQACNLEAIINQVMNTAENVRLFIQELAYCDAETSKQKKLPINPDVKTINKSIIPAIMRENRSADRIERDLERISKDYEANKTKLANLLQQEFNQKALLKVGKSFRAGIDSCKKLHQEGLEIHVRLNSLRTQLINLEGYYFNQQNSKARQQAPVEVEQEDGSVFNWIANLFNGTPSDEPTEQEKVTLSAKQQELRQEFEQIKEVRRQNKQQADTALAGQTASAKAVALNKKLAKPTNIESLEQEIKQLGSSIEVLSGNIETQLKELEQITQQIAGTKMQQLSFS